MTITRKIGVALLLLCGLRVFAVNLDDAIERSLLRGIGRPFPLGELINLHRSPVTLPDPPDIAVGQLVFSRLNDRRMLQYRVQSDPLLADAIRQATALAITNENSSKAADRARSALLLALSAVAFNDTLSGNQAWRRLLLLPPPPTSGGPSENDSGLLWGDLLEGSYALANAALAFDMLRTGRNEEEQAMIVSTLIRGAERIRNGIEFIGPNNHASSSGANLAITLLALPNADWNHRSSEWTELWRIAERLLQIGLAQVGPDGVYREGPGYAQEVLGDVTRLALLLHEHGAGNLLRNQLLHRFATVTAQLSRHDGSPLPFDDSQQYGANLWRQVATLLPNEPLIAQFSSESPVAYISAERLFEIARFANNYRQNTAPVSIANVYRDGGMAIVRKTTPIPWLVAIAGEPRQRWTGRHEQIDPGNLLCEVGSEMRITTGGYGPGGVDSPDRHYWLSGEAYSAFLVDGDPLRQTVDSGDNENSPAWSGVTWDSGNLLARQEWNQFETNISRTLLTIGERIVIIDRAESQAGSTFRGKVESQFQLLGDVTVENAGNWVVGKSGSNNTLHIATLPSDFGTMRAGVVTNNSESTSPTTRLRLPISPLRITLLTLDDSNRDIFQRTENKNGELLHWRDADNTEWSIEYYHSDTLNRIQIHGQTASGNELNYSESVKENDNEYQLQLHDLFGDVYYPAPKSRQSTNATKLLRFRNGVVHDTTQYINRDGWLVSGSPRFQLNESLPPSRQSQLERLATVHDERTPAEQVRNWNREDRAALDGEIADSVQTALGKGADSLGIGRQAAIAMAAIDATTDGFVPGKFRIPFDADETISDTGKRESRIRLRGKWGGGLEVDKARYDWQRNQNHWAIERSAPYHSIERYQAEWGNEAYFLGADHANGDRSGFDAGFHSGNNDMSSRIERLANNQYAAQSSGRLNDFMYALRGNDSLRQMRSQWAIRSKESVFRFGGEMQDDRALRIINGNGWLDFDLLHQLRLYGFENSNTTMNREYRLEQFLSPEQNWSLRYFGQQRNTAELRVRGISPNITNTARNESQFALQWEDSKVPWVQFAKLQTLNLHSGTWSLFTERPAKRQWGTEWQWSRLPWITSVRIAAQDRFDHGGCQFGYLAPASSYIISVSRDPDFADATATLGIHSLDERIGEWRIECGWRQPTTDWFRSPNSGISTGAIERHVQSATDWGQRIIWQIGPGDEKSAEGGITVRW